MEKSETNLLGATLREARGDRSARSVARAAGISVVYLRALETGLNRKTGKPSMPSAEVTIGLSQALNLDPNKLLNLTTIESAISSAHLGFEALAEFALAKFKAQSSERRKTAAQLIEEGHANSDDLTSVTKELRLAEAYHKASEGMQTVLNTLKEDLDSIH